MEHNTSLQPHVIIMPSPGMGHLIPVSEFAKCLVLDHGFSATLIIANQTKSPFKAVKQALEADSLPNYINTIFLPPVDISDLPSGSEIEAQMSAIVTRSLPALAESIRAITASHRVISFVCDLFSTESIAIANEFDIDAYIFQHQLLCCCVYTGLCTNLGIDLIKPLRDRKTETYARVIHYWKKLSLGKGIFINSFEEIEHGAIEALNGKQWDNPPVYPIGPLIRTTGVRNDGSDESCCLKWLDNQSPGSVLFVSFGSGGTLSVNKNSCGFSKSPTPSGKAANASYLCAQNSVDPSGVLPKGFLDRTQNSGLVVSSWAPQIQILEHGSTGGFLTHCGWNSTLESIVHGVPLIAFPLFAEQTMNAVMLTDDLKVAIRPKTMKSGIIGRDEICKVVKKLMEGEEGKRLRSKMEELKCAATSTLAEAGSSAKTFAEAVSGWKNH
ncbi:hypothetical protein MKW92_033504 [Papaver armeniacum]|nr:hypothetical protein MKW92_033504 [Papaver armeniacum]